MVAKAADAIVSGAVMGLKLQPFEAHIPYLLQFKIDMNLYGMSHVLCSSVQFRREPPGHASAGAPPGWAHTMTQQPRSSNSGEQASAAVRAFLLSACNVWQHSAQLDHAVATQKPAVCCAPFPS
jgi:hypothetical protein